MSDGHAKSTGFRRDIDSVTAEAALDPNNAVKVNIVAGSAAGGNVVLTGATAVVSAGNSSTTPLAGGASFTGTSVDLTGTSFTSIQVQSIADKVGTVQIQFSTDNTNWDHTITGTAAVASSASIATGIHGRYARVVYVNGAQAQTYFRLQTLLVPTIVQPTVKDLDTPVEDDDNAMITHSLITGHSSAGGGSLVDVKVNPSGTLTVDATNSSNVGVTGPLTDTQLRATPVLVIAL